MKDFRDYHVMTIKEGSQVSEPLEWNVVVNYDSKKYYYFVPRSFKEEFEDWVNMTFWRDKDNYDPECTCPYSITWR